MDDFWKKAALFAAWTAGVWWMTETENRNDHRRQILAIEKVTYERWGKFCNTLATPGPAGEDVLGDWKEGMSWNEQKAWFARIKQQNEDFDQRNPEATACQKARGKAPDLRMEID